jgi:hypothetical protein
VVSIAQLCEYTPNHLIVQFKKVNFNTYELYLNRAATEKKKKRKPEDMVTAVSHAVNKSLR